MIPLNIPNSIPLGKFVHLSPSTPMYLNTESNWTGMTSIYESLKNSAKIPSICFRL